MKNIKICLCTPVKKENRYIREFVEFYEKYGIDKIFLYDNNNINGERIEPMIMDYLKKGFTKIINRRGIKRSQYLIMNDCYIKNYKNFDWIIFYDVDEYIYLKNFDNIKLYLNQEKFKNCQKIHLNWVQHTDNNLINYDNRTVRERFPEVETNARYNKTNTFAYVKSILKGHIPNIRIKSSHILNGRLKGCNGFGESERMINGKRRKGVDYSYYYIDHYYSKSLEEVVEKINKGDSLYDQDKSFKIHRIYKYFSINKLNLKKIEYLENHIKLNLSILKKKLLIKKFKN